MMGLFPVGTTPKQRRILDLWCQWQVVSWKGLGLLCLPMLATGMASHLIWAEAELLNLWLALGVGISLYGASVGDQQRLLLAGWVSNASRWRRNTTWGTLWGSLAIGVVSFLGFSLSAALIVTLILMPFGLLVGWLTPLVSGSVGGLILGLNQQRVLRSHLQQAHLWPLWSSLGGLIAGLMGMIGSAVLTEAVTDLILIFNHAATASVLVPVQVSALSLLISWAIYQGVTGFAMAWLLALQSSPVDSLEQ